MTNIDDILAERGKQYGEFSSHARISQELKEVMASTPGWAELPPDMKEALEMNAHKVARILNGNPRLPDHWDDIAGYAKLVADRIRKVKAAEANLVAKGCKSVGEQLREQRMVELHVPNIDSPGGVSSALNLGRTISGDPM